MSSQKPSDAEVAQLHSAVLAEQHVSRLDVSVKNPDLVRSQQGVSYRKAHSRNHSDGQRSVGGDHVTERPSAEVLRHEIRLTVT